MKLSLSEPVMEIAGEQHDRTTSEEHHNHRREDQHASREISLDSRSGSLFRPVDPMVAVRIGNGKDGQSGHGENGDDDPRHLRKQSGKNHCKAADDPHLTGKAVGGIPVFTHLPSVQEIRMPTVRLGAAFGK